MSDESIRRVVREELSSQWAYDQFCRRLYGVGQPVNEATLAHYVSRRELHTILNEEIKTRVFKDVHRIMGTQIGVQELFARYRDDLDCSLQIHANTIENNTVTRLEAAQSRIVNDVLRTDNGNRIIDEVERRVQPGAGFYIGITLLGFTGGLAGAMVSRLV